MKKSLESAGIQGKEIRENNVVKGTAYQLPNGVRARAMNPAGVNSRRISFDKGQKGTGVSPEGKNVNPPFGLSPKEKKDFKHQRTHINQSQ